MMSEKPRTVLSADHPHIPTMRISWSSDIASAATNTQRQSRMSEPRAGSTVNTELSTNTRRPVAIAITSPLVAVGGSVHVLRRKISATEGRVGACDILLG